MLDLNDTIKRISMQNYADMHAIISHDGKKLSSFFWKVLLMLYIVQTNNNYMKNQYNKKLHCYESFSANGYLTT